MISNTMPDSLQRARKKVGKNMTLVSAKGAIIQRMKKSLRSVMT